MEVLLLLVMPLFRPGPHLVLNLPNFVDVDFDSLPSPLQGVILGVAPELVLALTVLDEGLPLVHNQDLRILIGKKAVLGGIGILSAPKFMAEVVVVDIKVILLLISVIHEIDGADGH